MPISRNLPVRSYAEFASARGRKRPPRRAGSDLAPAKTKECHPPIVDRRIDERLVVLRLIRAARGVDSGPR